MCESMELDSPTLQELRDIANKLRIHSITSTNASKSGHPTSCASIAEIMSVLFFREMRYNVECPRDTSNDRLVLSKGHAAPVVYAAWAEAGLFPISDLANLRKIDSDLEGHPTPRLNFIDVATGSLGQGLSIACGMAYVGKYYDKASYRTYCILGDGECAEGSVWEALNFASYYKLDNLCVIFDVNRLGQSDPTILQHDMDSYKCRICSFGLNTVVVDGHSVQELVNAFSKARASPFKPTAIVAKTFKGKSFDGVEDQMNWHGKPLGEKAAPIIKELEGKIQNKGPTTLKPCPPQEPFPPHIKLMHTELYEPPSYKKEDMVATRLAYGVALAKIAKSNPRIIGLDGDTKNSTFSEKIMEAGKDRFIECFIAEQNMVGVAIGAACRSRTIPFVSTFGAFFTRAFDQLRMAAISQANIKLVGSHCGVSIGEDGPSQMALEDLAMFRVIPGSTIFYPSDAVSTERAVELASNIHGICFIRTSRPTTPILYDNNEQFEVGKGKLVKYSLKDEVLVIGAGVTLHEAITAAVELQKNNVNVRVLDPFTVKPIDKQLILSNAHECGNMILTVEDHYAEGGLGEAVLSAVSESPNIMVKMLAVEQVPRSGPPKALLDAFRISSKSIVKTVMKMVKM